MKPHLSVAVLVLAVTVAPQVRAGDAGAVARFRILVPEDAYVFVERERMRSEGEQRVFVSPPLEKGRRYTYEFSVIHEGQEVVRTVRFEAGRTVEVDFRGEIQKLSQTAEPAGRPLRPIRPVWLPKRVWVA